MLEYRTNLAERRGHVVTWTGRADRMEKKKQAQNFRKHNFGILAALPTILAAIYSGLCYVVYVNFRGMSSNCMSRPHFSSFHLFQPYVISEVETASLNKLRGKNNKQLLQSRAGC